MQVVKFKEDKKRLVELEKKCRLLEDTVKAKNPNSIGMLIQAAKTEAVRDGESESKRELNSKIAQLELELEHKDREYERKLRAMRQEQERMKALYEERAANSGNMKMVRELESELEKTKSYYNKRIREIEDKHKYGKNAPKSNRSNHSGSNSGLASDLKEQNERLLMERNQLAQKVADLEQENHHVRMARATPSKQTDSHNRELKSVFYPSQ